MVQKIKDRKILGSIRGQMLVEALVAMGILTVAVFAIFSMLTRSTSLNRVISQQYVATYLAAEGLELVKNITDSNLLTCGRAWNTGAVGGASPYAREYEVDYLSEAMSAPTGRKLKINPLNGFYQYQTGDDSIFTRTVTIESIPNVQAGNPDVEIRVTAIVKWRGRGGTDSEVRLEDHFFMWRPLPAGCS